MTIPDESPVLTCENPYMENFFAFRWANYERLRSGLGVFEGPKTGLINFSRHVSYSAWAHMRDLRWLKDPSLAEGSLRNFVRNQREDGSFPGHIAPADDPSFVGPHPESFYHANWGRALLDLYEIHPNISFWKEIYPAMVRYAQYMERERDRENSHMFDVVNQFETGQEFSPRYAAVCEDFVANQRWGEIFRLKGVDATVYMYELYLFLAKAAPKGESAAWKNRAKLVRDAVREHMWDPKKQMFFDVDPATMRQTGVRALTCFYPYMTDIVLKRHLPGLSRLWDPREFWTPIPFPTAPCNDAHFSPDGYWEGTRDLCPWNGRVWPMTNSHIAEAIAQSAIRLKDEWLRIFFVMFFSPWIKAMCFDGDPKQPNSFEHYHPFDGSPSTPENGFGGSTNGYLHSWINDLIIKYVVGLRPSGNRLIVDPFPFRMERSLSGVPYRGRLIDIHVKRDNTWEIRE